jgi:hypothetical protein
LVSVSVWGLSASSVEAAEARLTVLTEILPSQESARYVGEAYLASYPSERDRDFLVSILIADNYIADALRSYPHDSRLTAKAIARAVRSDFIERRIVKLDGWVLSLTEARLCALHTLA